MYNPLFTLGLMKKHSIVLLTKYLYFLNVALD
jgi:hypothetical protein